MEGRNASRLALFDLRGDGCFFDPTGEQVVILGVADLQVFFDSLDRWFEAPIGRKLLFAAADAEELALQSESFLLPKWFGKNRVFQAMRERYILMGWGVFEDDMIKFPIHDTLAVGFSLAHREHATGSRWNVEWHQQSSEHIRLAFQPKPQAMHPATRPNAMAWGQCLTSNPLASQHALDIDERPYGFFVGEQRCAFLPVAFFDLLTDQLRGRRFSPTHKVEVPLTCSGDHPNVDLFSALVGAAKEMFQNSSTPVYVRHNLDWEELLTQRFTNFGYGRVEVEQSIVEGGDQTVFSIHSSIPAFACGVLMGMWERCHGLRCEGRVEIHENKVELFIGKPAVDYS